MLLTAGRRNCFPWGPPNGEIHNGSQPAKGNDQWHYREQSLVGIALTRFCETVKRTSPLLCHVLATATLVLLMGIVTLSTGSRFPSFRSPGPTWHTAKVSRMHETREETGKAQESEAHVQGPVPRTSSLICLTLRIVPGGGSCSVPTAAFLFLRTPVTAPLTKLTSASLMFGPQRVPKR
jgi:hypothetical protein